MREFRESDEPECTTCGACCTTKTNDGSTYVPVTALDRRRLPGKYQKKLQAVIDEDTQALALDGEQALGLKRFGDRYACVALKGTLGKDISCDVYAQRPEFCRAFERGSKECRERRAAAFHVIPTYVVDN